MSYYMNMSESSGSHGMFGRIAEERYKQEKKKNDDADKRNEKIQAQYKRAGYEDKIPEDKKKADRYLEDDYKDLATSDKEWRADRNSKTRYNYAKAGTYSKARQYNTDGAYRIRKDYYSREEANKLDGNRKTLHDRINNRAKHECGIFSEVTFLDEI